MPDQLTPEQETIVRKLSQRSDLTSEQKAIVDKLMGRLQVSPEQQQRSVEMQQKAAEFREEQEAAPQRLAQEQGPVKSFFISAGKGMFDVGRGVGRIAGADYQATPEEKMAMAALEKERPYTTMAGEMVGETAPFAPLATVAGTLGAAGRIASSKPVRMGVTAGLGAIETGLTAAGEGRTAGEISQASGIGGVAATAGEVFLPPIGRRAAKLFRKVMGRAPKGALISKGIPTPEMQKALDRVGMTMDDLGEEGAALLEKAKPYTDPDQAARAAALEKMGFKENTAPTKAQIERTASLFQEQQEAAKISGKVKGRLQDQNALLENQFMDITKKTGGNPATTGSVVADHIVNKATELDNQIGVMYEIARKATGDQKVVSADGFFNTLERSMPDNDLTSGLVKAIKGVAKDRDIIKVVKGKKGIPDQEIIRDISVSEAEDLVKSINKRYTTANPNSVRVGRILKDAIDEDVTKAGGSDLFKKARKMKAKFHGDLERTAKSKFSKRKISLQRDILEEKITPGEILQKGIISKTYKPADISDLKNYLHSGSLEQKKAGKNAWNELRAEAMEHIKNQAFSGPEDELGRRTITRARLESALNKFGPEKLKVLFTPKENQFLNDLHRVTKIMEPISGTYLGKGPTAQAVSDLGNKLRKAIDSIPVAGAFIDLETKAAEGILKGKPIIYKPGVVQGAPYSGTIGAAYGSILSEKEESAK
ncbi:MAG: hypothetical protein KJP07_23275 [Desulfatitalea sp.]|nr:hypothetical protein [Desulfatitalea sp.]